MKVVMWTTSYVPDENDPRVLIPEDDKQVFDLFSDKQNAIDFLKDRVKYALTLGTSLKSVEFNKDHTYLCIKFNHPDDDHNNTSIFEVEE